MLSNWISNTTAYLGSWVGNSEQDDTLEVVEQAEQGIIGSLGNIVWTGCSYTFSAGQYAYASLISLFTNAKNAIININLMYEMYKAYAHQHHKVNDKEALRLVLNHWDPQQTEGFADLVKQIIEERRQDLAITLSENNDQIGEDIIQTFESIQSFVASAYPMRHALFEGVNENTKQALLALLEALHTKTKPYNELSDEDIELLIKMYSYFDEKAIEHHLFLANFEFALASIRIANVAQLTQGNLAYFQLANRITSTFSRGFRHYYNGDQANAKETIYNGIKELAMNAGPIGLVSYAALPGIYPAIALGITSIIVSKIRSSIKVNAKDLIFRERHQLIDKYYQYVSQGDAPNAAMTKNRLLDEYGIDPDRFDLMAEVSNLALDQVKAHILSKVKMGLINLYLSFNTSKTRDEGAYYQQGIDQLQPLYEKCCGKQAKFDSLLKDQYPEIMGLIFELELLLTDLTQLDEIKDKIFELREQTSPIMLEYLLANLAKQTPEIVPMAALWAELAKPAIESPETIHELISQIARQEQKQGTDYPLARYFREAAISKLKGLSIMADNEAQMLPTRNFTPMAQMNMAPQMLSTNDSVKPGPICIRPLSL